MEKDHSPSTDRLSTKSSLGGKDLDRKGDLEHIHNEKIKELNQPVHEFVAGVDAERDFEVVVEDGPPSPESKDVDPYFVTWSGPNDPDNPRNWSFKRKWAAVFVVSSFTFISPVSSSMVAPALPIVGRDLGIKTEFETAMVLSIFVLSYAIGPLFFAPLSEVYGRVRVLQTSNLFYFAFNLGCAFAKTGPQMLAFRFWAGFGGSAMLALGGGILSDCFVAVSRFPLTMESYSL
jgi:Major Facilitator Superfamily